MKRYATVSHNANESRAVTVAGGAAIFSLIASLFIYKGAFTPIFGQNSVGLTAALFAGLAAGGVFFWGLYSVHPRVHELRKLKASKVEIVRRWVKVFAVTFVMAALTFLLTSIIFYVIQEAFRGVTFDMYAASAVTSAATAASAYIGYLVAVAMTPMMLSSLLALFLVGGVLTSAISNSNAYWWTYHFSSLGGGGTTSAEVFNITLIISGLVIWVLAGILTDDITVLQKAQKALYPRRTQIFHVALVVIGIALALVGGFVYNEHATIHNSAAGSMVVVFLALIGALPWILPHLSREFYVFSYGTLGILMLCVVLYYNVGYFNLTTFELSAGAIIFTWIVVLVRQIAARLKDIGDDQFHLSANR